MRAFLLPLPSNTFSMDKTLLQQIDEPADLRRLLPEQLTQVADELRSFILDVVSANPGHLGASLGVVELTVALHYLFNTPDDLLVWDVGHQAYGHKILTGRLKNFDTLRQLGGVSGFPVRSESTYDAFGTGHASTGLSAALGMATASALQNNRTRQHIAVVGDGAMTGGMFFEALNQAGGSDVNLLIILNDNGISIDKSAGALTRYLSQQRRGNRDNNPLFEAFGIRCFGPVDGNKLSVLLPAIEEVKSVGGVRLLHVTTTKGKGFDRAEKEQVLFHAPGTFDRQTGQLSATRKQPGQPLLYQEVFGETLVELAGLFPKIAGITPAMPTGSSLNLLMQAYPERAFDVDIAEQHALTFAAGLATGGLKPFCVVYSTFLQRAYDQLIHDIALQNLAVVLCIDRAGLVGEDGATHHGAFDLAYLQCIPNLCIAAPMDACELRDLMYSAAAADSGPWAIRYPRGKAANACNFKAFNVIEKGKGRKLRDGKKVAVISIGHTGNLVAEALDQLEKENIHAGHYDLRFLKPLDQQLLREVFDNYTHILTVEDGSRQGGMGWAVSVWAAEQAYPQTVVRLGIPDQFVPHGSVEELRRHCGFSVEDIQRSIRALL